MSMVRHRSTRACRCPVARRWRQEAPSQRLALDGRTREARWTMAAVNTKREGNTPLVREDRLGSADCSGCSGLHGGWYSSAGGGALFGGCSIKLGEGFLLGQKERGLDEGSNNKWRILISFEFEI
ncbi:uncharacterized protein DS421_13g404860 [Arachis hypogaea]|nr:uncharacterized protein DS421_13g404860 [Arachis hypogaea]